jgi:hypothetical protein
MSKIWSFIYGVVTFYVNDCDVSRINRLRKFCPFNVKCGNDGMTVFSVRLKYFQTVKKIFGGFEYTVTENCNLPRGMRYLQRRIVLCIVITVCCLTYFLSDCFVYDVRVVGGQQELNSSVENYLQSIGVTKYIPKIKIKNMDIANNIIFNFADIAHTNVRLAGATLLITILQAEVNSNIDKRQLGDYIVKSQQY